MAADAEFRLTVCHELMISDGSVVFRHYAATVCKIVRWRKKACQSFFKFSELVCKLRYLTNFLFHSCFMFWYFFDQAGGFPRNIWCIFSFMLKDDLNLWNTWNWSIFSNALLCFDYSIWPAFVPVHDPTREAFFGIQNMGTIFTRRFDADRIRSQVPIKLMHLEGLYQLFSSKFVSFLSFFVQKNYSFLLRWFSTVSSFSYVLYCLSVPNAWWTFCLRLFYWSWFFFSVRDCKWTHTNWRR